MFDFIEGGVYAFCGNGASRIYNTRGSWKHLASSSTLFPIMGFLKSITYIHDVARTWSFCFPRNVASICWLPMPHPLGHSRAIVSDRP